MKHRIFGKQKQLILFEQFYDDNREIKYEEKVEIYNKLMKYLNQTCYMLIKDDKILFDKIGFIPEEINHKRIDNESHIIECNTFDNIFYLCGILDAEGSIGMNHRLNRHRQNTDRFTPIISFTNTNKMIIEKCCSTLKNNNIGYHVQFRVSEERNRGRWDVMVSGIKRTKHLSDIIKDSLIIKKQQTELLNKYCDLRMQDMMGNNLIGSSYKEAIEALNKNS